MLRYLFTVKRRFRMQFVDGTEFNTKHQNLKIISLCHGYLSQSQYYYWGEPERAPHKRYSNARNIWYMYICIYVYMYICMYICMVRPSSVRRFIDSVRRGQGRPHACAIFCADQRHPRAASGPHAIFCAEKSAHKKELRQHAVHLVKA